MITIAVLLGTITFILAMIWWELVLLNLKAGRKYRD